MRIDAFNSLNKVYQTGKAFKAQSSSKAYNSDKVEISRQGRDYQIAKAAVADAPDVREDLVADIKARIANGTYVVSSEAFANKVVEGYANEIVF